MKTIKLDILALGAHPDDVELSCGGTLALHAALNYRCGVVDLTRGEMGTRGTPEIRMEEARKAAEILGLQARENLGFADGFFEDDRHHQLEVARMIRRYRPEILLINAPTDRHPDHGRGASLVRKAAFLAGLAKVSTQDQGEEQEPHRPQMVLHYIQFQNLTPDLIIDIGGHVETKIKAIEAYLSQFHNPNSQEPETVISSKNFLDSVTYRAQDMGRLIGSEYGEGFIKTQDLGLTDLMGLKGVR